jgi:hypothetical protein
MVVRLQTEEGRIKKYRTAYGLGLRLENRNPDSEHSCSNLVPKKYVTNCGLEWKDMPSLQDECDHLDCAIYLAAKGTKSAPLDIMGYIIFLLISILIYFAMSDSIFFRISFAGLFAGFAFYMLTSGLGSWKNSIELAEYKDRGTIDGITAWQIFEDQKEAKAKH